MSFDGPFLEAAAAIGRRIVTDAIWHDGRCSWVGAAATSPGSAGVEYQALGPDLYGGTAGIGLFLAHMATATGDGSFRHTAVGALRHSTTRARQLAVSRQDGLHAGSVGVAWAAANAARLLDEEELRSTAHVLAAEGPSPDGDRCPDVATGMAGCILGLLSLAGDLDDPRLAAQARATGDAIVRRATVSSHGWSWAIPGRRYRHHLCGAAHGAGGIGWALLELFAATGEQRFRDGVTGAFAYERSWLDPGSGRWPDLRVGGQRRGVGQAIDSGMTGTWCYGEAGIALTRLCAIAALGEGPHCEDADAALETTRTHLADALPYAIDDLSLCHGASGAADVLVSAAALSDRWRAGGEVATELGHVALERRGKAAEAWPRGVADATPGLFRGLSGIGWLFLRLHDPGIPSPLSLTTSLTPVSGGLSVPSIGVQFR